MDLKRRFKTLCLRYWRVSIPNFLAPSFQYVYGSFSIEITEQKEPKCWYERASYSDASVCLSFSIFIEETGDKKRPPPPNHAITSILNKAHRRGYRLSFVIPKVEGTKPSKLARNSFVDELPVKLF